MSQLLVLEGEILAERVKAIKENERAMKNMEKDIEKWEMKMEKRSVSVDNDRVSIYTLMIVIGENKSGTLFMENDLLTQQDEQKRKGQ